MSPLNVKNHFLSLHQDAVMWKAQRLWINAFNPDEQAIAIDQLTQMMLCITNETKRMQYIEAVQKNNKIKNQLLKKAVKDILQRQEAKRQQDIAKKKLENLYNNAEEAGLANGFKGNIYDALKYGIYEHEGVYYTRGVRGADYPVSNFTMKILYHIPTGNEQSYRLIMVRNVYGFESFINLNTDDFVSLGAFKKVLARRGDYVFKGNDSDLSRLQELLQKDEAKTDHIESLGWHRRGKFYAFANGIVPVGEGQAKFIPIDDYGIINNGDKNYFLPALSRMYREKDFQFVNEKKFVYKEAKGIDFNTWSKFFYDTYGKKSIPALLFFIGSLYRDIIMKQIQRYPILCLFGPPGAGKGQMAESLLNMFGEKQDQIMLGGASTVVGFMRKFAQFVNAIVWLDEYKNNLPFKFIESFKNIYDGKGYERGKMTNDFSTESTPIHSSCILSGQDMPTVEPALFMRTILLSFEEGKFSEAQRKSFIELKDMEADGLSSITAALLQHREVVEDGFKEKYQLLFREIIKSVSNNEVDDRMMVNISILLVFYQLLKDVLQFPFSYIEAKDYLIENMLYQHNILQGNSDVSKFWSVIESLWHLDLIKEGKDFAMEDGYLYIRLMQVHPLYMKELRQRGDANVLMKPTLEHYLKLDKTVYVDYVRKRFEDGSNNWCYKMRYAKLGIDLIKIVSDTMTVDQKEQALSLKYKEMGIALNGHDAMPAPQEIQDDELPFPKNI